MLFRWWILVLLTQVKQFLADHYKGGSISWRPGTLIGDCLASCCGPCSLLQMKKELDAQGVPNPFDN
ncbi:unnamed protein product [Rotaria socialis]